MRPLLPKIKRGQKHQAHVDRPVIVTGNFDLHFEEVIHNNRILIIVFIATGLLAVSAFIPNAVYESLAGSQRVTLEVENGKITNPSLITIVKGDTSAGGESYIEFGTAAK